jgi:hypothetical protein
MTIQELLEILSGTILVNSQESLGDIPKGGAADLMSDVLAFGTEGMVLMTGLTNPQVVRTSEMAGVSVIVFVRNKMPPQETLSLAEDLGISVVSTAYTMYEACGLLYKAGLPGRGQVKMENDSW